MLLNVLVLDGEIERVRTRWFYQRAWFTDYMRTLSFA